MDSHRSSVIRALAAIVAVAAGIRIVFWLLQPVWPYLVAGLILFALARLASWYRDRC